MEKNERLRKAFDYLRLQGKITKDKDVAVAIGADPSNISRALSKEPTNNFLKRFCHAYDIFSLTWLLTGEGDMLKENDAVPFRPTRRAGIPLVSQYAYGGYLCGYQDPEWMEQLPRIDFTPDREMTGNYLAFEIKGDSMDDGSKQSYIEGEIVICREVEPYLWRDSKLHINRRDFVIVHEEGILIKRIIAHDVPNHTITIHSLNPMYPDREIDLAQVRQIFSVVESRMGRLR